MRQREGGGREREGRGRGEEGRERGEVGTYDRFGVRMDGDIWKGYWELPVVEVQKSMKGGYVTLLVVSY